MMVLPSYRIEFLGPPGVGKTTLFQALLPQLRKIPGIIGAPDLAPCAALSASRRTGPRRVLQKLRAGYHLPGRSQAYRERLGQRIIPDAEEAVAKLPDVNRLLTVCFHALADQENDESKRLRRAQWLVGGLRQAALCDVIYRQQLVVFDELLCQLGLSIALAAGGDRQVASTYFSLVHPPRVIVVPTLVKGLNRQRIVERDGPDSRHARDLSASEGIIRIARETLEQRGVLVFEVSGEGVPSRIARDLANFACHAG